MSNNHVNSSKHSAGKERLKNKQRTEMELIEVLKSYDAVEKPKDVTLSNKQRIYGNHIKVVHTFLLAGVPLNKLPAFRELLEDISDLVPFILTQEKEKIKQEIQFLLYLMVQAGLVSYTI